MSQVSPNAVSTGATLRTESALSCRRWGAFERLLVSVRLERLDCPVDLGHRRRERVIAGVARVLGLAVLPADAPQPVCNRLKFVNDIIHAFRIDLALELCLATTARHPICPNGVPRSSGADRGWHSRSGPSCAPLSWDEVIARVMSWWQSREATGTGSLCIERTCDRQEGQQRQRWAALSVAPFPPRCGCSLDP